MSQTRDVGKSGKQCQDNRGALGISAWLVNDGSSLFQDPCSHQGSGAETLQGVDYADQTKCLDGSLAMGLMEVDPGVRPEQANVDLSGWIEGQKKRSFGTDGLGS